GHEIEKLESVWEDTTLKFLADARGFNVQGHVTVENDAVHVHATLPLAAALLKGYIERTVTEKLGTALS
ncbi:MAG: polyhydroxyalkanoic acid system family protein, partial [Planctomycetales bacterium]|nr:polyhydroxyalkanoic acid system family protein [Planctomycetales bacterium]